MNFTTNVKRQHTVPRFLLKNFGFGKKENKKKLFSFDKQGEKVFQQSVNDATVRNSFYNFVDDPKQLSLESYLGEIESITAVILSEIIKRKSLASLDFQKKEVLSIFILTQYFRTFGHLKLQEDMLETIAGKVRDIGGNPKDVKGLNYGNEGDLKNSFLINILSAKNHKQYILNKNWHLFETDINNPFFISDHPIVLHNEHDFGPYGNLGLNNRGIQLYLPISTTLMIGVYCPSYLEELLKTKENVMYILASNIKVEKDVFDKIDNIHNAIDDFTKTTAIMLSSENVKFYNSLQVTFSEQFVYCEKNEFSLIRDMIKDSDRYKTGMRLNRN